MEETEDSPFVRIPGGTRQFVPISGMNTCKGDKPSNSQRVWYQRTGTGSGVLYLFIQRPKLPITSWYAEHAFGWVAEWPAQYIKLRSVEGWCNFWGEHSTEAHQIEGKNPDGFPRTGTKYEYIEFTDDLVFRLKDNPIMRELGLQTDHARQDQHWRTPAIVAQAVLAAPPLTSEQLYQLQNKEILMSNFDPHSAAAEQQARLAASASKQGKSVNNVKQACSTALANVAENNKSAAIDAGYLTAGTIANNQFAKVSSKHLPMMVRGYADTPLGKLVLANVAQMLVQHFKADNKAANRLTEAMMTSAMAEVIGSTGIEDLIDGFLNDPKIAKALKTVEPE